MRTKKFSVKIGFLFVCLFILESCITSPLATINPSTTPSSLPSLTLTSTFIPVTPSYSGTRVPDSAGKITLENLDHLSLFAQWGNGNVSQISYTSDGNFLVVGHSSGVFFYNTKDYSVAKSTKTTEPVLSIAITPDGLKMAVALSDKVLLYNTDDLSVLLLINVSTENIVFSPDGKLLATSVNSQTENYVETWDANSGVSISKFNSPDFVMEVVFSADGKFLVAGGNSTKIWSLDGVMTDQQGPYSPEGFSPSVSFFPNKNLLVAGTDADAIRILDVLQNGKTSLQKTISLAEYYPSVNALSVSPDEKWLVAGTTSGVYVWRTDTWELIYKLNENHSLFGGYTVSWSPDSKTLAFSSLVGGLEIWDITSGALIKSLFQTGGNLSALSWSPLGNIIAVGTQEGYTYLLQTQNGVSEPFGKGYIVNSLAFSPDGQKLAIGYSNVSVDILSLDGDLNKFFNSSGFGSTNVYFSPDGEIFASSINNDEDIQISADSRLEIWKIDSWILDKKIFISNWRDASITDFSIAYNKDLIAISYIDRTGAYNKDEIKILNLIDDSVVKLLEPDQIDIAAISFSPDGEELVVLSGEGDYITPNGRKQSIWIWDANNWELLRTIDLIQTRKFSDRYKNILSWSPDGIFFAVGVPDGTIQIRKTNGGELLQTITAHNLWVTGVAFSPDGHYLASISLDGTVRLWGVK